MLCVYYHVICTEITGVWFSTTFILGSKELPRCLYVGYQLCCVYTPILFTQNLPRIVFQYFFSGQMVTRVFVRELSTLLCLYYHVIYIQVTGLDYLTFFGRKVTMVLVRELSSLFFLYYHDICTKVTGGIVFNNFHSGVKRITVVFVCELSALLCVYCHHIYIKVTWVCFSTKFFPSQNLPALLCDHECLLHYQVVPKLLCYLHKIDVYIILLFRQKLSGYVLIYFLPKNL